MGMQLPGGKPKRSKHRNRPVYRNAKGLVCKIGTPGAKKVADSGKEYRRRVVLESLAKAGVITHLRFQVVYKIYSKGGHLIETYRADFAYVAGITDVVEDVKGQITGAYRRKRKWMKAEYGISILET